MRRSDGPRAFARVGISFKTVLSIKWSGTGACKKETHITDHTLTYSTFQPQFPQTRGEQATPMGQRTQSNHKFATNDPSPRHTSAGTERALRCQHATPNPAENTRPAAEARACGGATTALVWCSQVLPKGALLAVTAPARSCQRRAFA